MLKENLQYITVAHLCDSGQISTRTANCCISVGLDTLYKIVLYFEENGSFFKKYIKNAGFKTCEELDELCANVISKIKIEKPHANIEEVFKVINELTEQEQEILLSLANLIIETEKIIREKSHFYSTHCANNFSFAIDFYRKNGHLPMLWIVEQILNKDSSIVADALKKTFNVFQNQRILSLAELAKEHVLCNFINSL
jgi:hypothetical protein